MNSPGVMSEPLPEVFDETVNLFQRLILVKALREVSFAFIYTSGLEHFYQYIRNNSSMSL